MRTLLLSDIHANWWALEAVLGFLKREGIGYDRLVILGDYVDYGTRPNEVIEWSKENCDLCLLGNHDAALLDPRERDYFSDLAYTCSVWTEKVVKPENREFLKGLRPALKEGDVLYAHAAPDDPLWRYIFTVDDAYRAFGATGARIIFVGHTHVPSYFARHRTTVMGGQVVSDRMEMRLLPSVRYIINPGAVGQPRDGLRGASFGIYDDEKPSFTWYRVEYDLTPLKEDIERVGLPMSLLSYHL